MDIVSYNYADRQSKRIKKFIYDPDSNSGIVTMPKVIGAGENVTIPTGRVAVLPNVIVEGELNIEGEAFIPAGVVLTKSGLVLEASNNSKWLLKVSDTGELLTEVYNG